MNKHCYLLLTLLFASPAFGQVTDTLKTATLKEVIVTAYKEEPLSETSLDITPLVIDSLSAGDNFNLTDLMAKTPGVSMLSTGVAIAKPVIRGLYGNRVLVLLSGLKFDNQQWQEEHGLGLSDVGLGRVELIKGPLSVLYGSEAMGGVVNLIEEQKPPAGEKMGDVSLKFHSNTLGGLLQGGYKANLGGKWFRIRAGIENNGDYSDGSGDRVLNSRFDGYYLKGSYGFQKRNWVSVNTLSSSFNRFGFIFNDVYTFITPDDRWSRKLSEFPAHLVLLNILSSENKVSLKNGGRLYLNAGLQSNQRMENEGGGAISLNMHLLTFQYMLKWEKELSRRNRLILSNLSVLENNTNFGARKIVPDAWMQETNLSAYLETHLGKIILENGAGIGEKYIGAKLTPAVNGPDKEISPFTKFSPYFNVYSGMSYLPSQSFNLKLNVSTGVRIPNLAELSSDGLHEGVFTYEIGDPDLENERNLMLNLHASRSGKMVDVWASLFYNRFFNYVYLAPTDEEWFGFPIYRYRQQDARQWGGEAGITVTLLDHFSIGATYSGMMSKTEDGNYTPFIPAQKIAPQVSASFKLKGAKRLHVFSGIDYYFEQNHTAPSEIATPDYFLLDAGASVETGSENRPIRISLSGSNLLNESYYDHLSRFKYFGLLNMGRNITLQVKYSFIHQ